MQKYVTLMSLLNQDENDDPVGAFVNVEDMTDAVLYVDLEDGAGAGPTAQPALQGRRSSAFNTYILHQFPSQIVPANLRQPIDLRGISEIQLTVPIGGVAASWDIEGYIGYTPA